MSVPRSFHEKAGGVKFFLIVLYSFFIVRMGSSKRASLLPFALVLNPFGVRCRLGSGGRDYLSDELRPRLAPVPCSQERSSSPNTDPHRRPRPIQKFSLFSLLFFTFATFFIG